MRNGRLLAEDSPNTLMNLYTEDVSSCADTVHRPHGDIIFSHVNELTV